MDKNYERGKTLLTALSSFEQFIAANNKEILDKAQYSYHQYRNTPEQCDNIIDKIYLTARIRGLENQLNNTLDDMPETERKILMLCHVKELSSAKVAELLNVSQRTVFRRLSKALRNFEDRLDQIGITESYYNELLNNERWIRNIHRRISS